MNFVQHLHGAISRAPLDALARDLLAVEHKLRHPLADILAKVPGDSLAARARALNVSRQTMYAWAQERFRPSKQQAKVISELTGVPVEQITDYQEGKGVDGLGISANPPRKKIARVAKAGRHLSPGAARLRAKRAGMAAQQGNRRYVRKADGRNPRRPVGGEGD